MTHPNKKKNHKSRKITKVSGRDGVHKDCSFSMQQSIPRGDRYPLDSQVYRFVTSSEALAFHTTSATLPTFAAAVFSPATIIGDYTSYAAVFDQYRITKIELWLIPRLSTSDGSVSNPGLMSTVVDFDDGNTLASVSAANDYANCITASGVNGHYRSFIPHIAVSGYTGGAFSGFVNSTSPWIDASYGNTQHFGFKTACTVTSTALVFDLNIRVHSIWRNQR
jgi:hypothetical protein